MTTKTIKYGDNSFTIKSEFPTEWDPASTVTVSMYTLDGYAVFEDEDATVYAGDTLASAADADTITVTVADSGAAAGSCEVAPLRIEDFTDFSAVSGVQQGSTSGGVQMIRAAVAGGSYASGKGVLEVTQSGI